MLWGALLRVTSQFWSTHDTVTEQGTQGLFAPSSPPTLLLHILDTQHNGNGGARDHPQVCDHQIHQLHGGHVVDQIEET